MSDLADDGMDFDTPKKNKLGYTRTSVACAHCRRRKIRCLRNSDDPEGRCENCIKLKKHCVYVSLNASPSVEERVENHDQRTTPASLSHSSSTLESDHAGVVNMSERSNRPSPAAYGAVLNTGPANDLASHARPSELRSRPVNVNVSDLRPPDPPTSSGAGSHDNYSMQQQQQQQQTPQDSVWGQQHSGLLAPEGFGVPSQVMAWHQSMGQGPPYHPMGWPAPPIATHYGPLQTTAHAQLPSQWLSQKRSGHQSNLVGELGQVMPQAATQAYGSMYHAPGPIRNHPVPILQERYGMDNTEMPRDRGPDWSLYEQTGQSSGRSPPRHDSLQTTWPRVAAQVAAPIAPQLAFQIAPQVSTPIAPPNLVQSASSHLPDNEQQESAPASKKAKASARSGRGKEEGRETQEG